MVVSKTWFCWEMIGKNVDFDINKKFFFITKTKFESLFKVSLFF